MTDSLGVQLARGWKTRGERFEMHVPELRSLLTTTNTSAWTVPDLPVLPPLLRRPQRLRDVIPSVPSTSTGKIPYVREIHVTDNEDGAEATSEASAKPEAEIEFEGGEKSFGKIDAWVRMTNEALEDPVGLEEFVRNRLAGLLDFREDYEILNGIGLPGYDGILQDGDIQTATSLAQALQKVDEAEGRANAVAVNPADFWATWENNATGGANYWSELAALGVQAIRTNAVASGKMVVGDFTSGAVLRDKPDGIRVRISLSHDSLFISNTAVVLAERRSAFIIRSPQLFVEVTI